MPLEELRNLFAIEEHVEVESTWGIYRPCRVPAGPGMAIVRTGDYRGGNWPPGTGAARAAVGGLLVNPMTAQLMTTPTEP